VFAGRKISLNVQCIRAAGPSPVPVAPRAQ
jgi:hypothetical protein